MLALVFGVWLLVAGCAEAKVPVGASPVGAPQRVEVHYAEGGVRGGVSRVSVSVGTAVALVITSDVADEVHLHGYNRAVDVPAGGTATLHFVADRPGVFEAELESRGVQLVQLEVR